MHKTCETATLAVLAGGEGSRMGTPKGNLTLDGRPILRRLVERIAWPGPTLLVTAPGSEGPTGRELFDAEAVDPVAGLGPLRGVLTALERSTTSLVVVVPVDMPCLDATQLAWLVERLAERPASLGLMTRRAGSIEPFPSVFRLDAAKLVRERLDAGIRSVQRLTSDESIGALPAPDDWPEIMWTNLNRPADVEAFVARESKHA